MKILETPLLTQAQQFQREHKWQNAIDCYKQYLHENREKCEDTVFVSYARSLRIISQTNAAKEVLKKGMKQHPNSEPVLLEFYHLYDFLGDWISANNVAKTLVNWQPQLADYHFYLGRTYSFLSNRKKAKTAYKNGLECKHQIPFNKLVKNIQSGFAENTSDVKSNYIYVDGKNNLGGFIHTYQGKRFFTKISPYSNKKTGAGREESFYKQVCTEFTHLKGFTPKYIDSQIIDGILYLTIEMIDSIQNDKQPLKAVVQLSQQISSIRYEQVIHNYPRPNYVYQFKRGRAISVVHFFTHIHEKKYNTKLFDSLKLIIKQQKYPKAATQVITRLEESIMRNQLYNYIHPTKHYGLLHGDLGYQNVIVNQNDGLPRILDWSTYTIGPHFIDIARYLTSLLVPYSTIKTLYLDDNPNGQRLSTIERIFFLYAVILFYFQKIGRLGIETNISSDLLPALEDLEVLVMQFKNTMGENEMTEKQHSLSEELREKEVKIKQLEQRLSIVEDERKYLHKRLQNIINSKSWKITTPLRIFTEGIKKKELN